METKNQINKESKSQIIQQKIKSAIGLFLLAIVGLYAGYILGVIFTFKVIIPYVDKARYEESLKEYLKPYEEDNIGGNTPEETVDLFIEALKKGDYDLASKYFVVDEQEKWKKMFNEATKQQNEDWARELENEKKNWHKEMQAEDRVEFWYNTCFGENERPHSIVLRKNINNKWKLGEF